MTEELSALLKERLQRALSYREQTAALTEETGRALASGRIDQARHDALSRFYKDHHARAEAAVQRLFKQVTIALEQLEDRIEKLEAEETRLRGEAASGQKSNKELNRTRRDVAREIAAMTVEAVALKGLLAAQSSADLGGFLKLPLDRYEEVRVRPTREKAVPLLTQLLAGLAGVCAGAAVFIPWLRVGDYAASLVNVAAPLVRAGVCALPAPITIEMLWIPYLLAPFGAALLGITRAPRLAAAWGLLGTGVVMIAASCMPFGVLALRSGELHGLGELAHAARPGAWVYASAGLVFVALGAHRRDLVLQEAASSWRGPAAVAGLVAAVFLVAGWALVAMPAGGRVTFSAALADADGGTVVMTCSNHSNNPINVHLPWPEGGPRLYSEGPSFPAYGVVVHVRATGQKDFRLLSDPGPCWRVQGRTMGRNEIVAVGPGLTVEFALDLRAFREDIGEVEAIRLVFVDKGGKAAHTFESSLPPPARVIPGPLSPDLGPQTLSPSPP